MTMATGHTRKEVYHEPRSSSATDHHSLQVRGSHDRQYYSRYGPREPNDQWQRPAASSGQPLAHLATPWRYPPLSFDLAGPGVPGTENAVQNHSVTSQPTPMSPVSHRTPGQYHHYPPRAEGPASPVAKYNMWTMDGPSEARTTITSSQWAIPASPSPISTLNGVPLPLRTPMTPSCAYESSRHEVGNDTRGNVDKAPHPPWLQFRVSDVLDRPSNDGIVPALPSMVSSQLTMSPLDKNETLFDPFKLLESISYLDVDQRVNKQPCSELGRFFLNTGKVKQEIADSLASEFDEYCRSRRPMQPSAKFFIRTEAAVLGRAVFYSREATLHILTDLDGLIMCPYHTDIAKNYKIGRDPESRRRTRIDAKAQRESGKLHCGCSEDDVILEMMLRKLTVFPAETEGQMSTMRGDFLNPRDRSFVCSLFRNWTGLNAEDIFKYDNDGRFRTYEDLLKAQISRLQNRLAWVEAACR